MRLQLIYPGPTHSTYDVAEGYQNAFEALGVDVARFLYHNHIRFYQEALKHWETDGPVPYVYDQGMPFALAAERAALQTIDFKPDAVLIVAGAAFHPRGYELLKRLGVPILVICTESPYNDRMQNELITGAGIKMVTVNDLASVAPTHDITGADVAYLPHSYDPARHYPDDGPRNGPRVFFHGTLWDAREELLGGLRDIPGARISGFTPGQHVTEREIIPNSAMAELYRRSVICVNNHRVEKDGPGDFIEEDSAYSLGPRAFEIAACGGFQISDYRAELAEVFGDSVPVYRGARQLRELVLYYLEHAEEREALRLRQLAAVQSCTFESRARNILLPFIAEVLRRGV